MSIIPLNLALNVTALTAQHPLKVKKKQRILHVKHADADSRHLKVDRAK